MKKNLKQLVMVLILAIMIFPASVRAEGNNCFGDDLKGADQEAFSTLIDEIQCIKEAHPEFNDERILEIIDQNHTKFERGISDIWNSLTDSEKKLCIRYPFAALKVNTAKNIATSKTESKFGMNGLGDRSDAFRHGIWNAEMTILIGKEVFQSIYINSLPSIFNRKNTKICILINGDSNMTTVWIMDKTIPYEISQHSIQ